MGIKNTGIFYLMVLAACVFSSAYAGDSSAVPVNDASAQKYFEVLASPSKILREVNPQSPILGFAYKNDIFPLIFAGTTWYQIIYKNDTGWVEGVRGRIINTPTVVTEKIPRIIVITAISVVALIVAIFGIVLIVLSLKRQKFRKKSLRRDVLIISSVDKEIRYSLTDASTTVSKCFSEIGFKVNDARDVDHARILLVHYAPDVLMVDWRLEKNIFSTVLSLLASKGSAPSVMVIFFNVPDPAEMYRRNTAPFVHFVGIVFSDRDIFKIVTPLIMEGKTSRTIKKSVQSSALEGDIGAGNLVEVMQFIEIGRKTGSLHISARAPIGIVCFEQGRITYAGTRRSTGKNAVNEILDLTEGRFRFVVNETTSKKNANLSTLEVLMDWTKGKDEARRH